MASKYTFEKLADDEVQFTGASGKVYTCRTLRMSGLRRVVQKVGRSVWDANPMDPENMIAFLWYAARRTAGGAFLISADEVSVAEAMAKKKKGEEVFPSLEDFADEFSAVDFGPGGKGGDLFLDVASMSGVFDPEASAALRTVHRRSGELATKELRRIAKSLLGTEASLGAADETPAGAASLAETPATADTPVEGAGA